MEMWNVQPSIYGRFLIIEKYDMQTKHSYKLRLPPSQCPVTILTDIDHYLISCYFQGQQHNDGNLWF